MSILFYVRFFAIHFPLFAILETRSLFGVLCATNISNPRVSREQAMLILEQLTGTSGFCRKGSRAYDRVFMSSIC